MSQHRRRSLAVLVAVVCLAAVVVAGCGSSGSDGTTGSSGSGGTSASNISSENKEGGSSGPIKLPAIEMLTGEASYYGQLFMKGIELAVSEIDAEGGVEGSPIELIKEDNASENAQTVTLLRKYCSEEDVGILIAPTFQTNSDAGGPVSNACGLPTVTGVGDIDEGTNPDGYMFKNTTSRLKKPDQIEATLKWAIEKTGAKRVAQISDETVGPFVQYREDGEQYLKENSEDVSTQAVQGSVGDYGPQITALEAARPELVVVGLLPEDAAKFIEEAKGRGLEGPFVATCGCLNDPTLFEASHGAAEGFLSSSANPPPEEAQLLPSFAKFVKSYEKKFGGKITDSELYYTYDSVKLIAAAIEGAGSATDREKLKETLEGMKEFCGALCYVNEGGGTFATTSMYFTELTPKGFEVVAHE